MGFFRTALVLAISLIGLAPAMAQDHWDEGLTLDEALALSPGDAVAAILRGEIISFEAKSALYFVASSGDPGLHPQLREIVESFKGGDHPVAASALFALVQLGETPDYFLGVVRENLDSPNGSEYWTATWAARSLVAFNDSALADSLRAIRAQATSHYGRSAPLNSISAMEEMPAFEAETRTSDAVAAQVRFLLVEYLIPFGLSPLADDARDEIGAMYPDEAFSADAYYATARLRQIARAHPDSFRIALPAVIAALGPDDSYDPAADFPRAELARWAMRVGLPHEPYPAPPAVPDADVAPVLECVERGAEGWTAYFGYHNRAGRAVTLPHGPGNALTVGGRASTRPPQAFASPKAVGVAVGRTPPWPGYAVSVPFAAGEPVTWTLPGGTATASTASPACGG